jgi:hypothetical protein
MVVNYSTKANELVAEPPRVWLEKTRSALDFDVASDGKRLLLVTPAGAPGNGTGDHQIVYIENFFDELRRRVPGGNGTVP